MFTRFIGQFFFLTFCVVGCASYTDDTRDMRQAFERGDYSKALEGLRDSSFLQKSQNRLLLRLEEAMILDRAGKYDESQKKLIEADKIVDELYTVSISKTAASFVLNDSTVDYAGEDFEKVAIHAMLALSFLSINNLDSARVSARRINSKLNEINEGYEKTKEQRNKYGEDAFARYLAGAIYESRKEWDSAIIDYAKALEQYQSNFSGFVIGGVPDQLVRSLYRLYQLRNRNEQLKKLEKDYPKVTQALKSEKDESAGEILVFHDVGQIAYKVPENFFLPISGQLIRVSFPVLKERANYGENGIQLDLGGRSYRAENVSNLNSIARASLEDRRLRSFAKMSARLVAKGALTEAAYRNFGPIGGIAANVFAAASETADTRGWTLLPQAFYATRARVAAGEYEVTVKSGGKVSSIRKISVKAGDLVILR